MIFVFYKYSMFVVEKFRDYKEIKVFPWGWGVGTRLSSSAESAFGSRF